VLYDFGFVFNVLVEVLFFLMRGYLVFDEVLPADPARGREERGSGASARPPGGISRNGRPAARWRQRSRRVGTASSDSKRKGFGGNR